MEPLRFILVGTGGFGTRWINNFIPQIKDHAVMVAAVSRSERSLELPVATGLLPRSKCYTDIRRAIEENPCDFLALVIPPSERMPYIDLAIEYGLDVICEKPVAPTMDEVCEIYKKLTKAGRKASVTMSHRMERDKQSLNRLLDSGAYGELNYIVGRLAMLRRPIVKPRYVNGTIEELIRNNISGGLIHEFDTFRGLARSNALTVYANFRFVDRADGSGARNAFAVIEMQNGVRCQLEHSAGNASELNYWKEEYYRAECDYASLELDKGVLTLRSDLGFPHAKHAALPLADGDYWDHALIIKDFCEWVRGGREPETSIRDNMYCSALTFAAAESALTGRAVNVPAFLSGYNDKYALGLEV